MQKLPGFAWMKIEKESKECTTEFESQKDCDAFLEIRTCHDHCPVCNGVFFPSLVNDMSAIVSHVNQRAKKLLKLHQAAGPRKYFFWFKGKLLGSQVSLIKEGKDLLICALTNAMEIQEILKKFDEFHNCCQVGPAFKSKAQSMQHEILRSPWLRELMALHINLRKTSVDSGVSSTSCEGYHIRFNENKPSLSCDLSDSIKLDLILTCPICLNIVFDAVSLTCGHILCQMCACAAASVTIVEGLKSAEPKRKCPLCRQAGVYERAVHLTELSMLVSRRCREYWEKRLQIERVQRVKQAKIYWESQCRAFMGI